jgi:cell division protein FtsI/penicillin-binding protein 2
MESLNSKEKSKKTWQFIFIFFALALLPVAAIFFSYFKMPEALQQDEKIKLEEYSNFMSRQNSLLKELTMIDSNFTLIANENTNLEPTVIFTKISNGNEEIKKIDSSDLVKVISKMIENHANHMHSLQKLRNDIGNYKEKNDILKERASNLPAAASPSSNASLPSVPLE